MAFGSNFIKFTSSLSNGQSDRQLFLRLPEGSSVTVRILDYPEFTYRALTMKVNVGGEQKWRSIPYKTLSKELADLRRTSPNDARTQIRSLFNVVDRTRTESGDRRNTVHLLDASRTLMEQLVGLSSGRLVHPSTMKPISIHECDITITTRKGTPVTRYIFPDVTPAGMEPLPNGLLDQCIDPRSVVVFFPPSYQVLLLRGEDYLQLLQQLRDEQGLSQKEMQETARETAREAVQEGKRHQQRDESDPQTYVQTQLELDELFPD